MKVLLQRVKEASVMVDSQVVGQIGRGIVLLVGIDRGDIITDIESMTEKCLYLRIFDDDEGRMNRSVLDVRGGILAISQFTLCADTRKGRRPNFIGAA
ncbi:MAG: D-tyrosyl-tRNA(Tyr) deacylase, partial [Candidatus Latescibacteria bacterium]|nr:D-tyrosyl-tRNA(Tyr) deacylase [Candidatus Latescibacterota bacterium]